jgi:drug/metabolite transporter (DMT)-like permease
MKWMSRFIKSRFIARWKLHFVVLSWYILGCVSITTTKLLLRDWGVSPLDLTAQQLLIGACTLHLFLSLHLFGCTHSGKFSYIWTRLRNVNVTPATRYLVLTALCFALGFYATNRSFFASHASFVETIKAAEPITSASVAYLWGIEGLSIQEGFSLLTICAGVVISTVGNALIDTTPKTASFPQGNISTITDSFLSTGVVLLSNLCFSFRGLFQKLFRACPEGNLVLLDDVNLQLRVQQIGTLLFITPVIILDGKMLLHKIFHVAMNNSSSPFLYMGLAIINGIAFATYK